MFSFVDVLFNTAFKGTINLDLYFQRSCLIHFLLINAALETTLSSIDGFTSMEWEPKHNKRNAFKSKATFPMESEPTKQITYLMRTAQSRCPRPGSAFKIQVSE